MSIIAIVHKYVVLDIVSTTKDTSIAEKKRYLFFPVVLYLYNKQHKKKTNTFPNSLGFPIIEEYWVFDKGTNIIDIIVTKIKIIVVAKDTASKKVFW